MNNLVSKYLKEKLESFTTQVKMKEFLDLSELRTVRVNEVKILKEIVDNDLKKIKNSIKFLIHTNWVDDVLKDIEILVNNLKVKKENYSYLYEELDKMLPKEELTK